MRGRAFTLIEVTIAGTLLAVGMAGLLTSWGSVMGILEHERRFAEATNLARTQLDKMLIYDAGAPALSPGAVAVGHVDAFGQATPGVGYDVGYIINNNRPSVGNIEVQATVSWLERSGPKQTSLLTYRER